MWKVRSLACLPEADSLACFAVGCLVDFLFGSPVCCQRETDQRSPISAALNTDRHNG